MSLPEITALCRVLARSDAQDSAEQARNFARLTELNEYLRPHADPGMAACLEACTVLMGAIHLGSPLGESEILAIVRKLMAAVEKHWSGTDPDALLAEELYADDESAVEAATDGDDERQIESRIHGAKAARFKAGDIEEAQVRIDKLKRTPRLTEMVLGEMLVELGHAGAAEVVAALDEQERTGELLGEILVARGSLTREVIDATVRLQVQLRAETTLDSLASPPPPAPARPAAKLRLSSGEARRQRESVDDNTLGAILMRQGSVTQVELERAMALQRGSGLRLGETLVEMHAAGWETINRAVELQRRLRSVAGLPRKISF
jgi:hypothetical protein